MKYAHLADLHLGSWRDEKMRALSTKAFLTAIDQCVEQRVDFILFAGDLFNTSLPALDILKIVTKKLKQLNDQGIPLYVIAGSHDFSPSGKTMIDVLENAGLLINVCQGNIDDHKELTLKFTQDPRTGAKITGIIGRRGMLDKTYYENLQKENIEQEEGYKIFMFHTSVTELMPIDLDLIESQPLSLFPKNCDYYAGGHIHHPTLIEREGYKAVTYTGALFPNNFKELEKFGKGGYYIIDVENENQKITWMPLKVIKHESLNIKCMLKTPESIMFEILSHFNGKDLTNTVITIRVKGKIKEGRLVDINFKHIFEQLYKQGAYFIMKNTVKLHSEEFEEVQMLNTNPETVEDDTIKEHLGQIELFGKEKEFHLTKQLINVLNTTRREGEKVSDYNKRIEANMKHMLKMSDESKRLYI